MNDSAERAEQHTLVHLRHQQHQQHKRSDRYMRDDNGTRQTHDMIDLDGLLEQSSVNYPTRSATGRQTPNFQH